jgi:hypothetical protein
MDIQQLIQEARDTMLADGHIMPTMQILFEKSYAFVMIDIIDDSQSIPVQCGMLARLGLEECRRYPDEKIVAIGFFAEAWQVVAPENVEQQMRPKTAPKRQEVIFVECWQAEGNVTQAARLSVTRDHKKRVTDIGQVEEIINNMSWQLASIVQGCADAQKSDEELSAHYETAILKKVAALPPELQRDLKKFAREAGVPDDFFGVK